MPRLRFLSPVYSAKSDELGRSTDIRSGQRYGDNFKDFTDGAFCNPFFTSQHDWTIERLDRLNQELAQQARLRVAREILLTIGGGVV